MNANNVFPSNYLKSGDIGDHRPVVTIDKIEIETLGQGEEQEKKPVIYFVGKEKGLVCNRTNFNTLIDLYGAETDDWIGKQIKLCTAPVSFRGKTTQALRILPMNPAKEAGAAKASAAPQREESEPEGEVPF